MQHIIIPDLPVYEYLEEHKSFADKYNVSPVFLITPGTSAKRIKEIDNVSNAFIYLVSGNTTTGNNSEIQTKAITKITGMRLKNPVIIGFGIKNKADYRAACKLSNGAIMGSAFINVVAGSEDLKGDISRFIAEVKSV